MDNMKIADFVVIFNEKVNIETNGLRIDNSVENGYICRC